MNINDRVVIKDTLVFGKISGVIYDGVKTILIVRENLTDNEYECRYKDLLPRWKFNAMMKDGVDNEITRKAKEKGICQRQAG